LAAQEREPLHLLAIYLSLSSSSVHSTHAAASACAREKEKTRRHPVLAAEIRGQGSFAAESGSAARHCFSPRPDSTPPPARRTWRNNALLPCQHGVAGRPRARRLQGTDSLPSPFALVELPSASIGLIRSLPHPSATRLLVPCTTVPSTLPHCFAQNLVMY
jgi:hypothetical protein